MIQVIPNPITVSQGATVEVSALGLSTGATITIADTTVARIESNTRNDIGTVTLIIKGLKAATTKLDLVDGITNTSVTIIVIQGFVQLTADGSGAGNDSTVFGRQYVLNWNLSLVNTIADEIKDITNTLRVLAITNQATNAVTLAGVLTSLAEINAIVDSIKRSDNPVIIV